MIEQLASQVVLINDGPSWVPYAIGIGTALTAVVALITAIVGVTSFRQNHKDAVEKHKQEHDHELQARALHYMERYDGRHHIVARARMDKFLMIEPPQQGKQVRKWEKMSFEQATLTVQGLNFWEELGGMYNRALVDKEIVDDYFGPEAEHIWKKIAWFVTYQRDKDPDAMIEMQHMYEAIRRSRQAEGKLVEPIIEPAGVAAGSQPAKSQSA